MGRASKPAEVIRLEGKSHRTKKELASRQRAETENLTGKQITEPAELKKDKTAHKEFLRIRQLLRLIKKDDELYGAPVRRYCINVSKLQAAEESVETMREELERLRGSRERFEEEEKMAEYYRLLVKMEEAVTKKEQLAQSFRKELADFEKENCMTIASSLRAIPKQPETKTNALREALNGP